MIVKSVLLVEDDPRLGAIIRDVLSREWAVTWETTIAGAEEQLRASIFDVLVVDRGLPDGDGVQLVLSQRNKGNSVPIIVLTAQGQLEDKVAGLDAGANDYLTKPFEFDELQARLRALTRDYAEPAREVELGEWLFYPDRGVIESPYTVRIVLTEKESRLVEVLASAPQTAFTREQLLKKIFDHGETLSTVDTYVHYVRKKTDRDLIETVRGVGYRLGSLF